MSPLGAGGMGQVWLAEHTGLDTQVAVKFMWKELAEDPLNVARFEREAKLAARIKSPHVVGILDYSATPDGVPFIVMELLHGRDLESRLENGGKLDLEDTRKVFVQICRALAKAHELGVVHRDIKAENLFLVDNEGDILVKVLDFGVAKDEVQLPGITISGTTVGTPSYMSPEQLFHPKEVDHRTDLWSAAVVVYRCLTGRFPFAGDAFPSVCLAVAKGEFPSASTINRDLPAGLDAWFSKAFHRNPNARFQSAREMLHAFLSEVGRATAPRPVVRRPKVLGKLGISALMAGAGLLMGLVALPGGDEMADSATEMVAIGREWTAGQGRFAAQLNSTAETPVRVDIGLAWLPPPSASVAFAEQEPARQATPAKKHARRALETDETAEPDIASVPSFSASELPPRDHATTNLATVRFGL